MALDSKHPQYAQCVSDWVLMRDAYEGERQVKAKTTQYLPATEGMRLDGMEKMADTGYQDYLAYLARAVFPDFVSVGVENYIGMLHSKDATIELPKKMEGLLERATVDGESLQNLLRRINEQQLVPGRLGLMLDWPANPPPGEPVMPYIATYYAEAIINWDNSDDKQNVNSLNLVVLDESGDVRKADFTWERVEKYRVLQLGIPAPATVVDPNGDGVVEQVPSEGGDTAAPNDVTEGVGGEPVYMQGVFENRNGGGSLDPRLMMVPEFMGKSSDEIPFVVINSKDIVATPDNPPLIGLGRLCMAIYRGEADYRQSLHKQGQDTLVVIGGLAQRDKEAETRVGSGSKLEVDLGGDAKFIGVESAGLEEQRTSLENDRKAAEAKAGTLISPGAGKQESGDALSTRLAAQTASLKQIAASGAAGLQNLLRIAAKWMGEDPESVHVTPNMDFQPVLMTGQEVTQYMAARTMGAPISLKSLHQVFVNRGLTGMTYEDELELIAEEDAGRAELIASLPQPTLPLDPNKQPPEDDPNAPGNKPGNKKPPAKT